MNDYNASMIAEFRANEGRVGGGWEGTPVILVHHVGRKSGVERVNPLMYMSSESDGAIYIFASAGGSPRHPDWYHNLVAAGRTTVEVGTETFEVDVDELAGAEYDKTFARQASMSPGFREFAEKTKGIRTIPILRLTRV